MARTKHLGDAVTVVEPRDEEQQLGVCRQVGGAGSECALHAFGERDQTGYLRLVGQTVGDRWQLDEGERVAGGALEDRPPLTGRQPLGARFQQSPGGCGVERLDPKFRKFTRPEGGWIAVARRGQQHDRIRLDPSRHETEDIHRGLVEPVSVLGDEKQRPLGRRLRQQVEDGQGDAEGFGRLILADPERRLQHRPMSSREFGRVRANGTQQLLQAGERESRF